MGKVEVLHTVYVCNTFPTSYLYTKSNKKKRLYTVLLHTYLIHITNTELCILNFRYTFQCRLINFTPNTYH